MAEKRKNPPQTQKSDSGIHVSLHPLVLLTISDYITRHTLRQLKVPIVGALLGRQDGLEITVEHAFECLVKESEDDRKPYLDQEWFLVRRTQMTDVHKSPAIDLVGVYMLVPPSGPQKHHIEMLQDMVGPWPEITTLLGFHPTTVLEGSVGGKLPLTIYEITPEVPDKTGVEDVEMTDDNSQAPFGFRELPYSIETGEAEMIGIDFVAKGGSNATAVETKLKKPNISPETSEKGLTTKGKKKQEVVDAEETIIEVQSVLSREEEELVASLTAKANAIKMLQSRINLIRTYLEKLPPSFISDDTTESSPLPANGDYTTINYSILRSIQALLNRLALLIPSDRIAFSQELLAEQNDVNLISLLNSITDSIKVAREVGRKFAIVDSAKGDKRAIKLQGQESWAVGVGPERMTGRTVGGAGDLMQ